MIITTKKENVFLKEALFQFIASVNRKLKQTFVFILTLYYSKV